MALVEGVKYGLSSHNNQCGNKSVIFVKLTDSALRAIDDYLKSQHKTGHRATLRFLGNEGNILIPSSSNENGHSFDFSLSTNTDIEGPQGSFECIQQCGPKSLESAGPLSYKMRIKANDDVFVQTQHRFNELETERRNECAKEIKSNHADIGRKVKKKIGMPPLPQRREKSPSYHPPPKPLPNFANNSSNSNLKLPNGYSNGSSVNKTSNNINNARKMVNGTGAVSANVTLMNGTASNISNSNSNKNGVSVAGSGSQDVSRRPLKERLIHMLAVKPYKKPELYQRLQSDGMKDRDKKVWMTILQQIASFKDNEYSLLRGVWNDVQEDWPFYSEQERQLMKRRKPQNLTPPGSDSSVGSGTSSLSPRSNSSIGSGHSPSSYSHLSSYSKLPHGSNGSNEINYKGLTPPDGNSDLAKGIKRPVSNGILTDNAEDYGGIPPKRNRVAHVKKPGSGSSSNGSSANANISCNSLMSRPDLVSKQDKDGLSPQFASHSNRIAERLSPIGTSGNFPAQNGSNGTNGVLHSVNNHKSPRNGHVEPMEVSPSHHSVTSNGFHGASQGEAVLEEPVSIGSSTSWQSRNGTDPHGYSDSEKTSRADSDETDSVDSGNGSSTSGGSLGGSQQQSYGSYHHSSNSSSHTKSNGPAGYTNGPSINKPTEKCEPISSSIHTSVNSSSLANGCNRVSSTTSFHSTPQSSPDSLMDSLQQKSIINVSAPSVKHNQRSNGKCNLEANSNIEIIVTREKGDSHRDRDRERRRSDRDRGKDKERDARSKDRTKRSDKKYPRVTDDRDSHEIENSDGTSVKLSTDYPSYLTKYTTITLPEQRSKYKEDFNAEYVEYRDLHAVIDSVSKRFAHLEERLRQEERGTDGYEKIKEQIVNEYYANKRNKKYQETRQKFQYLHEKLSHIKRLVADYDSRHQQEHDASSEYCNGY